MADQKKQTHLFTDVHPSLENFVPLPSDPNIPLTSEQLSALFPHPEVWRDVIAITLQQESKSDFRVSDTDAA